MLLLLLLSLVAVQVRSDESTHLIQVHQHSDLSALQSHEQDYLDAMLAVFPELNPSKLSLEIYNENDPATSNIKWTYTDPWPVLIFDEPLLEEIFTVPGLEDLMVGSGEYKSQMKFTYCNGDASADIESCHGAMAAYAATELGVNPDLIYSAWEEDENGCIIILFDITDPSVVIEDEEALSASVNAYISGEYDCNKHLGLAADYTLDLPGWFSTSGETLAFIEQYEAELINAMSEMTGVTEGISIMIEGEGDDAKITWVLEGIASQPEDVVEDLYCRMLEEMKDFGGDIFVPWDCIEDIDCVGDWKTCAKETCTIIYKITESQSGTGTHCPYKQGQTRYCQPDETNKPENCPTQCNPLWVDSHGDSCQDYYDNGYCTAFAEEGPGWDNNWGSLGDLANDGFDAMICPQCGCSQWTLTYDLEETCPYSNSIMISGGASWDQMQFYDCYSEEEFLATCTEVLNEILGHPDQPASCTGIAPGSGSCITDLLLTVDAPNPFKVQAAMKEFSSNPIDMGKFGSYTYKDTLECSSGSPTTSIASGASSNCPSEPEVVAGSSGGSQTIELMGGTTISDLCESQGAYDVSALVSSIGAGVGVGVGDISTGRDACGNEYLFVTLEGSPDAVTSAVNGAAGSGVSTSQGDYVIPDEHCIPPEWTEVTMPPVTESYGPELCYCNPSMNPPLVCPYQLEYCNMGCYCGGEYSNLLCSDGDMFLYPNMPCGNGAGEIPSPNEYEVLVYDDGECVGEPVEVPQDANLDLENISMGGMCVVSEGKEKNVYDQSYIATCDPATNEITLEYFQNADCSGEPMFEINSASTAEAAPCVNNPVDNYNYQFVFAGACSEPTSWTDEMTFTEQLPLDPSQEKEMLSNANFGYCNEDSYQQPFIGQAKEKTCKNNEIYTCEPPNAASNFKSVCVKPGYEIPNMAVAFYSFEFTSSECDAAAGQERRNLQDGDPSEWLELGVCYDAIEEDYSYTVNCAPDGQSLIMEYYEGFSCKGDPWQIGSKAEDEVDVDCQLNPVTGSYSLFTWEGECEQMCTEHAMCPGGMYCNDKGKCAAEELCEELDDSVKGSCPETPQDCNGVYYGPAEEDVCNVCEGDGTSCLDCEGVPFGDAECLEPDCAGVPGGDAVEDECGVCDGDNTSCADDCGVPNGDNACVDECGVPNGDNTECADCNGVPNGSSVEDLCGVCDGDDSSCEDCAGVPNGPSIMDCIDPSTTLPPCPVCEVCPTLCGPFTYSVDVPCSYQEAECHQEDIKEAIGYGLGLSLEDITILSTVAAVDDSYVTVTFEIPCQQELDLGAFNAMYQDYLAAIPELNEQLGSGYSYTARTSSTADEVTACSDALTAAMGTALGYAGTVNMKVVPTSAGANAIFGFEMNGETTAAMEDGVSRELYDAMAASGQCSGVLDSIMLTTEELLTGASLSHVSGQESSLASCMDSALSQVASTAVSGSSSVTSISDMGPDVEIEFALPAETGVYEALESSDALSNAFMDCARSGSLAPYVSYSYTVDIYGATDYKLKSLQATLLASMEGALGVDAGVTVDSFQDFDFGSSVTYGLDASTYALTTSDDWITGYCAQLNSFGIHYFKSFRFKDTLAYCSAHSEANWETSESYEGVLTEAMATVLGVDVAEVSMDFGQLDFATGLYYTWPYSMETSLMQIDAGALCKAIDGAVVGILLGEGGVSGGDSGAEDYTDICGVVNGDQSTCNPTWGSQFTNKIPAGDNCELLESIPGESSTGVCSKACLAKGGMCNGFELDKPGKSDSYACRLYGPQCTNTASAGGLKTKGKLLLP